MEFEHIFGNHHSPRPPERLIGRTGFASESIFKENIKKSPKRRAKKLGKRQSPRLYSASKILCIFFEIGGAIEKTFDPSILFYEILVGSFVGDKRFEMRNPGDEIEVVFDGDFLEIEAIRGGEKRKANESLRIFFISAHSHDPNHEGGNGSHKPKIFRGAHDKKIDIAFGISRIKREGIAERHHADFWYIGEFSCDSLGDLDEIFFVQTRRRFFAENV